MSKKLRTIITPADMLDLAADDAPLTYWKQILPEDSIVYDGRTINFDEQYHRDCIESFKKSTPHQTMLQLATPSNGHGHDMDPERQRAVVEDMATLDELPENVRQKVGDNRGLYAKLRFFDKKSARAVLDNPGLGVSARVRENGADHRGNPVKRAVVHILGTIDPFVTGMSPWQPVDLSRYNSGMVIDLSGASYEGARMSAKKKGGTTTLDDIPSLDDVTVEEIEAFTDEELAAFMAKNDAEIRDSLGDSGAVDEDDDEDDGDLGESDELDDELELDDSNSDDDTDNEEAVSLSTTQQRQLDLANSAATEAQRQARQALTRMADAEWRAERNEWIGKGVAPADLDLAAQILNRPEELVLDLSNEPGKRKNVNVAQVVRALLASLENTIDMSSESGHGSDNGSEEAEVEALADAHDARFPLPGVRV